MKQRLDYNTVAPEAIKGLLELEKYLAKSGLDKTIFELVKTHASQINGCAYCLDMHTKDARKMGETEQRLYCLPAWRETPFYTDKERAALEWTEAVTNISQNHISDELFERVSKHFEPKELMALNMAVVAINAWNRLAIPFRSEVGGYDPDKKW